jgi:Zn-dependent M28 family amino/carboxypeptidase
VSSSNVMGVLTGRKYPDEWVLYTAHWDHLGVKPDPHGGDSIYNGAEDNGTGLGVVLEIARNFARTGRTRRSVGFLFVTAEEQGLLGSEYYATNPLYPLAKTVADINSDDLRPLAPATDFSTRGDAPSTLQDLIVQVGGKFGRSFTPDDNPAAGYFYRSDHFSFAKRGVPALSFQSGDNPRGSEPGAGKAWDVSFRAERYHQPGDEMGENWRSDGLAADALMQYTLGRQLADSHEWPEWKSGAEFKAARDASAAERE